MRTRRITLRSSIVCTLLLCSGLLHAQDGAPDPTFTTGTDGTVHRIVVQPDGRILIGGSFTTVNGQPHGGIARLNADGTLDDTFAGPGFEISDYNVRVSDLALLPDGRVIAVGYFTTYAGTSVPHIVRLDTDGSLDATFDPGSGPDRQVSAVERLADGRLLIGGSFGAYDGAGAPLLARLLADGMLDATFDPGDGPGGNTTLPNINTIAVQPDGRVLVGGSFETFDGAARSCIVQLTADGALDPASAVAEGATAGYHLSVQDIAVAPDGDAYVVGDFTYYNGTFRSRMARLNSDGGLDMGFDPGTGPDQGPVIAGPIPVQSVAIQADGRVLIGGWFIRITGTQRIRLARLLANGQLDPSFDPGEGVASPNGSLDLSNVYDIALLPDGNALVGGEFTHYDGATHHNLVKVIANSVTGIAEATDREASFGTDATTLRLTRPERPAELRILDLLGNVVRSAARANEVSIADLPMAAYVLQVRWSDGRVQAAQWVKTW